MGERADAYRDQELARLFVECGWTQEKIARKVERSQVWVSCRLTFGRFLSFIASSYKRESLTEFRFRACWRKTKGKESDRFRQVLSILEGEVPPGYRNLVNKPGIRKAILASGRRHSVPLARGQQAPDNADLR